MDDVQLIKDALRLYKQALQETPGGMAALGRLALRQPDLLARLMAYEKPTRGVAEARHQTFRRQTLMEDDDHA